MAARKTVSMQDLAEQLGVSKVTVSKALNGKEGVGKELKEKIVALAQKSGYVLPDYGSRRIKKVGIIMSDRFCFGDGGKFYRDMYNQIVGELQKFSCSSIMISSDNSNFAEDLKRIESTGIFDGLIFLGILDRKVREQLSTINLPQICVDIYDKSHKLDSIVTENIYSSYEITNYLIQQGHEKIGFVGTIGGTTSITDRYLGYIRRMLEQGLNPNPAWNIPDRDEESKVIPLVLPEEMPTAFVCNCDETAFQLVKELNEKGYCVPEDVSVVGFDDSVYAQVCNPPLTTVAVNIEEIGKIAAKRMVKHLEKPKRKGGEMFRVPGRIIYRSSVKKLDN